MKILFVRHGESEDDLINAYGGWSDFPITENGISQIQNTAKNIENMNIKFSKIVSSPLSRAKSTSEIISKRLGLDIEIFEYLKERNSYGILSGMNKEEAKKRYPDQVQLLEDGEYVDGSERVGDTRTRAEKALTYLKSLNQDLIVVTHGSFLKEMFNNLGKKLVKKEDGGYILVSFENNTFDIEVSNGIVVE